MKHPDTASELVAQGLHVSAFQQPDASGYRGRFAPSPTGELHFGSLLAAFGSWLLARHAGGQWLVRIEDLDPPREVAGAAQRQLETLATFGLVPDQSVVRQSDRGTLYQAAVDRLAAGGLAFACHCSRGDLLATHGIHRRCVATTLRPDPAVRLRVPDTAIIAFDDALQGVTDVVRGADLLASTPRQILLQRALGLPTPRYAHLPLVVDRQGRKLSKSDAALPVDHQRPLPALLAAWQALGQPTAALADAGSVGELLDRARVAFRPSRIPRLARLDLAATHNRDSTKGT